MKAFAITEPAHRSLEQISLIETDTPLPADDEVLIAVKAVGLNPVDYKIVESGIKDWHYPHILGLDIAGVVVKVGKTVEEFQIGDRVCGHGNLFENGGFAEFAVQKAYGLAKIPPPLSFAQAAASLCAGMTAYQALFRKASLINRKTTLIHAASGGVGSVAVQLAKMQGLTVFATTSTAKKDFVLQLGADVVIDYQTEDVDKRIADLTNELGVDLIINTVDKASATEDLARLAYNGTLVCIVSPPDMTDSLFAKGQSINVVNLGGVHRSNDSVQQHDLAIIAAKLLELVTAGKLSIPFEPLPFEQIPIGLARIKARQTQSKLIAIIEEEQ